MSNLTFLIIGSGSIGQRHLKNLKEISPNIRTVLVRRKISNSKLFVKPDLVINNFKDYPIDKIDGIVLANPSSFRKEIIEYFIKNKKPLFIEKPITNSNKTAEAILKLMKKNKNIPVMVGYCLRFLKSLVFFKKIISSAQLGKTRSSQIYFSHYLPSWRNNINYQNSVSATKKLGGGILLEMSHELDYLQWIFGKIKKYIGHSYLIKDLKMDIPNHADIIFKTKRNIIVNLHMDMLSRQCERNCRVICENGYVFWDYQKNLVKWKIGNEDERKKIFSKNEVTEMYIDEMKCFIDMIKNKKNKYIDLIDSIGLIKIIEKLNSLKI